MVGTRRSRRKLAATSGVCVVLLGALAACGGGASATATQVPGYRVIHIEAGPNHPLYQILVEPGITPDQLRAITQAVIQKAQGGRPFSLMWLTFYDYPQLAPYAGPSLGWARFGPGSKFAQSGEYNLMSLSTYFVAKDWAQRPSQAEVNAWAYWKQLYWRPGHIADLTHGQLGRLVAKRFGMTVSQVYAAVRAVNAWTTPVIGRMW